MRDISNVKQEIINFRKVVRPQRAALPRPRAEEDALHPDDLDIYFDDIVDASERDLGHARELQGGRGGARVHQRVAIAHRSNETFRILTALLVIILPLTLIASIWGMNVRRARRGSRIACRSGSSFAVHARVAAAGCSYFAGRTWPSWLSAPRAR